jgi:hypothetical protein
MSFSPCWVRVSPDLGSIGANMGGLSVGIIGLLVVIILVILLLRLL